MLAECRIAEQLADPAVVGSLGLATELVFFLKFSDAGVEVVEIVQNVLVDHTLINQNYKHCAFSSITR
jgi:hypothetical protein